MSPEHLKTLKILSQLFEDGLAGPNDVQRLTELLSQINQVRETHNVNFNLDNKADKYLLT
jgi:hypothetical protein